MATRRVTVKNVIDDMSVSFSRIKLWRRCHRAHYYRYFEKLRKVKPPAPLIRGTICHEMIDTHTNGGKVSSVIQKYKASHGKIFEEEREIYGDMLFECFEIVKGYLARWKDDGLTRIKIGKTRAEFEVDIPLIPGVRFKGKIDEIDEDQKSRIFYTDHKTAKKIPDEDARFNDYQILLYGWAGPQAGMPKPDGVMWDYLRTKLPVIPETLKNGGLTKRKNIDTTYDVYMSEIERLKLDPKGYQEILDMLKDEGSDNFYRRIWLPFSNKTMVETVVKEIKFVAKEIQERGPTSNDRAMDRSCKWCQYYLLCSAELRGLDSDFIREHEFYKEEKVVEDADEENDD